jgi:hypothetical protein
MKRLILSCIILVCCIGMPAEILLAKGANYPGKELNGTWEVIKNDIYMEDSNEIFLPIGQKIAFWLTGDSHGYGEIQRARTGMDIGMKLVFPIDKNICKLKAWDYLCDESGNFDLDKAWIKNNAYIVTSSDNGLLSSISMDTEYLAIIKKNWSKNVKKYYYYLNMNAEVRSYDVHPMKNGNEILIFGSSVYGSQFPALLRRVKP